MSRFGDKVPETFDNSSDNSVAKKALKSSGYTKETE